MTWREIRREGRVVIHHSVIRSSTMEKPKVVHATMSAGIMVGEGLPGAAPLCGHIDCMHKRM